MDIDPSTLPHRERYKILVGAVIPRPIAWVSTISAGGQLNLAPFSYFNVVSSDPMSLVFCPTRRGSQGVKKDTLSNIEATGEYVINIPTYDLRERMNLTSTDWGPGVDEFQAAGLTPAPSVVVRPPRYGFLAAF